MQGKVVCMGASEYEIQVCWSLPHPILIDQALRPWNCIRKLLFMVSFIYRDNAQADIGGLQVESQYK